MKLLRKILLGCAFFICLLPLTLTDAAAADIMAEEISDPAMVKECQNIPSPGALFDGSTLYRQDTVAPSYITLTSEKGIGSLYISFGNGNIAFTIKDMNTNKSADVPAEMYMHRFIDVVELLGAPAKNLRLTFDKNVSLSEINVFTEGEVPDWVQKWEPPVEGGADLVLFSTHDDDTQLFFAGVLPYYAGELGYKVQVVFLTDHHQEPYRFHEMLNGLWAVGVRNYPVAGVFPDFNLEHDRDGTYNAYTNLGFSRDTLLSYVVENIRRFQPKVAIGHDINGEYGHGMHLVYTDLLMKAYEVSNDPDTFPDSAKKYGTWEIPKLYLHLYSENPIVMDWDQPLENFGGMTAYEVSRDLGFTCHRTQYEDFYWFYRGYNTAADVKAYSPCEYGLYRTNVGPDVEKNSFFENLTTYGEDAAAAETETEASAESETESTATEEEAKPESRPPLVPDPVIEQRDPSEYAPVKTTIPTWAFLYLAIALLLVALIIIIRLIKTR